MRCNTTVLVEQCTGFVEVREEAGPFLGDRRLPLSKNAQVSGGSRDGRCLLV